jgi:hypothetical protein
MRVNPRAGVVLAPIVLAAGLAAGAASPAMASGNGCTWGNFPFDTGTSVQTAGVTFVCHDGGDAPNYWVPEGNNGGISVPNVNINPSNPSSADGWAPGALETDGKGNMYQSAPYDDGSGNYWLYVGSPADWGWGGSSSGGDPGSGCADACDLQP